MVAWISQWQRAWKNRGQIGVLLKLQVMEHGNELAVLSEGKERIEVNSIVLTRALE